MSPSPIEASRPTLGLRLAWASIAAVAVLGMSGAAVADDWLVYLGGGLEAIEGGWEERDGQVLFRKRGGTLVSIGYSEVDLAASAFVTWQLNGRREAPARSPLPGLEGGATSGAESGEASAAGSVRVTCAKARVKKVANPETLVVETDAGVETVHVACLDAPDTRHRFAELGWFGRVAQASVEHEVRAGEKVCLAEPETPAALETLLRDDAGHRIVYVTLADGKDYAAQVIGAGLGLLRIGPCERAAAYRELENRAIADERGLWGARAEKPALDVATKTVAIAAAPGAFGAGGAGGAAVSGRSGALPPRRIGGG